MKGLFLIVCATIVVYVYSQSLEVRCPIPVNDDLILLPHPCNCSTYFVCFGDVPIPMPCPANLHFNATKLVCDWPWSARCRPRPGCPRQNSNLEEITP